MKNSICYGCPDRKENCAADCERWKAYEAERNAAYEANASSRIACSSSRHWTDYWHKIAKMKKQGRVGW